MDLPVGYKDSVAIVFVRVTAMYVRARILLEVLAHDALASNLPVVAALAGIVVVALQIVGQALSALDDARSSALRVTGDMSETGAEPLLVAKITGMYQRLT
jgi:hypothetical protein